MVNVVPILYVHTTLLSISPLLTPYQEAVLYTHACRVWLQSYHPVYSCIFHPWFNLCLL